MSGLLVGLLATSVLAVTASGMSAFVDDGAKKEAPPTQPPQKKDDSGRSGNETGTRDTTTRPGTQGSDIDPDELIRRREAAREALRKRHEEALRGERPSTVDSALSPTIRRTDGPVTVDTSRTAPGAQSENDVVRLEPGTLDLGDMVVDVSKTGTVKVHNISDQAVTISRLIASCGCTTAPAPRDPIKPGEYVEIPVTLAPGGRQGVNHSKRVTFQIEGHSPVVLTVQGKVAKHIDILPELLTANPDDPASGRIALSSADGEPFRILSASPAIVKDIPAEASTEHVVHIDWDLWERSGSGVRVTFSLDHPQMPAVSVMIRRTIRPGEQRPDGRVAQPAVEPLNPNTARLIAAAKSGDLDAIDAALRNGAAINDADRATGRTALHWAAREGHNETLEALLNAGAGIDAEDRTGKTPLSSAAELGRADAVALLLDRGAAINHRDRIGGSPLLWAAGLGNVETVKLLLDRGADVTVADTNGLTALLWAAGIGDPKSVELLLDAKADPAIQDRISGDDALIRASRSGKDETVRILLSRDVRTDARNNTGMTALHMAAASGSLERVKMLVEAKARADVSCNRGWTPLEHAKNRVDPNRDLVVAYLESLPK